MASGESTPQERTEQPTGRRREEAQRRGQVARSTELSAVTVLLGALGVLAMAGGSMMQTALEAVRHGLEGPTLSPLSTARALSIVFESAWTVARIAWPLVVLPAVLALGVQLLQTRFAVATAALSPRWSRLDPVQGLQRLLSGRSLVELSKAVLKLLIVGWIAYVTIREHWGVLARLGQVGADTVLPGLAAVIARLWLRVGLAYLAIAALDYGYQRWAHERSLRMTRAEVREEEKQTEGDPLLRSQRRALHRKLAGRRMLIEVRKADVVIRNPVHYAVALRYDQRRMRAPTVVAKGARLVALRIVDAARRWGVPVVENPPLARTLFAGVPLGREVPPALYRVVAEVLAYVYAVRGRRG
jgi:flagellar biosynthetic protein FlhB